MGQARAKDMLALECDSMRSERKVQQKVLRISQEAEAAMVVVEQGMAKLSKDVRAIASACSAVAVATPSAQSQGGPSGHSKCTSPYGKPRPRSSNLPPAPM